MPSDNELLSGRVSLVDAVDRLLDKGVVLTGEAMLSLGGVDLVYLGLNVLLGSVETLTARAAGGEPTAAARVSGGSPSSSRETTEGLRGALQMMPAHAQRGEGWASDTRHPTPDTPRATPAAENGLARLVLTLVELLRQLLERQALRRLEGNRLSEDEVERIGQALLDLEQKMKELCQHFGLSEADLTLDLGPLGPLL